MSYLDFDEQRDEPQTAAKFITLGDRSPPMFDLFAMIRSLKRRWTRPAAEQGVATEQSVATVQCLLGISYRTGRGVPQDDAAASRLFRLAADRGNATAQFNLGLMYDKGEGMPQDDAAAVRWYRLAAEQGDASAQFLLGLMYEAGRGMPQDDAAAVRWFRLAAEQGEAPRPVRPRDLVRRWSWRAAGRRGSRPVVPPGCRAG